MAAEVYDARSLRPVHIGAAWRPDASLRCRALRPSSLGCAIICSFRRGGCIPFNRIALAVTLSVLTSVRCGSVVFNGSDVTVASVAVCTVGAVTRSESAALTATTIPSIVVKKTAVTSPTIPCGMRMITASRMKVAQLPPTATRAAYNTASRRMVLTVSLCASSTFIIAL